jgi:hypothetical protein
MQMRGIRPSSRSQGKNTGLIRAPADGISGQTPALITSQVLSKTKMHIEA